MNEGISGWLFDQAPVIIVMGICIYWLAKKLTKAESEKDKLSSSVIKLTALWETKATDLSQESEDAKKFRREAIQLLKSIKKTLDNKKDS